MYLSLQDTQPRLSAALRGKVDEQVALATQKAAPVKFEKHHIQRGHKMSSVNNTPICAYTEKP